MTATITDVMQRDFPRLSPSMPIRDAVAMLVGAGISGAPVVGDDDSLMGMLTQKDCFRPALKASYYRQWSGTVADHMSGEPRTLDAGTDLVTAGEAFIEHPHRLFPVTDADRLVGLLRRSDVLAALLALG
ncbi:MAG: CBS domain-containing protein [Paracoccus sp. (in: a-proteobacteria)]|nr:CBS domain-containing protein [Paracoccus sp. (in: a-proteobacteria)]